MRRTIWMRRILWKRTFNECVYYSRIVPALYLFWHNGRLKHWKQRHQEGNLRARLWFHADSGFSPIITIENTPIIDRLHFMSEFKGNSSQKEQNYQKKDFPLNFTQRTRSQISHKERTR